MVLRDTLQVLKLLDLLARRVGARSLMPMGSISACGGVRAVQIIIETVRCRNRVSSSCSSRRAVDAALQVHNERAVL